MDSDVTQRSTLSLSTAHDKVLVQIAIMKSGAERTFDALLVAGSTLYSITALYCVYAMWTLRKQFSIAIRSPLLGCWIGATMTLRSWAGGSYLLISVDWDPESELDLSGASAVFRIIFSPASLVCVGAIIAWVVHLLVMYDPIKRRKWGRYTNERRIFRVLVWTFVLLEAGAWASAGVNGLIWTGTNLTILDLAGTLATLAAAVLLSGKLRKVHDIGRLSSDIQRIGALMVGVIFSYVALLFLPLPPLLFKYTAISLTIFPLCVVWITNIKPIRDYLRQHDRGSQAGLPILLWRRITGGHTPSHGSLGRVACTTDDHTRATFHGLGSTSNPHLHETALAAVMEFLPLQQAFGEYCRKALCSESFQFLVDVSGFQNVVAGAHAAGGESSKDFDEFTVIVTEYIKDGSNSEINIDCATKKKILELCERSAFTSLDVDDRENIFLAAEREIAKMLAENLLNKFKTTPEYKELAGDMVFETA